MSRDEVRPTHHNFINRMTILKVVFVTLACSAAAPRVAAAQTAAPRGEPVAGMSCDAMEGSRVHIHQHLTILDHGNPVAIPPNVGQPAEKPCIYWVHTHTPDGIIHIEAPGQVTFKLGQFFELWGVRLDRGHLGSNTGRVKAYVNGTPYKGDPRGILLLKHAQIQLEVGKPGVKPKSIEFPPGL